MQSHNWKTIVYGVLTILVAVFGGYLTIKNGGAVDWPTIIAVCLAALGMIMHSHDAVEPSKADMADKISSLIDDASSMLNRPIIGSSVGTPLNVTSPNVIEHADGSKTIPASSIIQPDGVIVHADGSKTLPPANPVV